MPKDNVTDVETRRRAISATTIAHAFLAVLSVCALITGLVPATTPVVLFVGLYCIATISLVWCTEHWLDRMVGDFVRNEQRDELHKMHQSAADYKIQQLTAELKLAQYQGKDVHQFKSEFLAHISHEIRTPLNAVVGMAELLSRTGLSQEQTELVSLISSSGETLLSVINDILNYSKIEAGEFTLELNEVEISDLVEGTAQLLAEQARLREVSLTTFISPTLSRSYFGDASRLKHVLVNLLGNLLRFAQKGEVLISAIENPQDKSSIRFALKDNSSSMTNSVVSSLFTPMTDVDMITARKYGGTGLGLSVSKRLVELMSGTMGVDTSEAEGTTFWFSVPLQPAPKSEETPGETISNQRKKVLLAGRASTSVAVIITYCKSWGLDCSYFPNGLGAITELEDQPDDYQVVIVESGLTDMSVVEFLSQLFRRQRLSAVHAMVLTEEDATEQAVKKLGVSLHILRKPFKKAGLREALRQCELTLRRTGEIVRPESQLKSYIASVDFATRTCINDSAQEEGRAKKMKLLVVEDNPVNRRLVLLQLQALGLDCDIVENGQEAIDALASGQYDLVFMDCWMPILDGFAATAKIRECESKSKKHTPIVAMTANAMDSDRNECLAAGMDDYISKPVTQTALKDIIDKWLVQKRSLSFDP